jgi:phosphoribosyl 1,2-cyclic phosphodiesterase
VRFASLGSGSRGNAWVVQAGRTTLMLDCGFGPREVLPRLARLGLAVEDIDGILVSHEHSDHGRGVARLAARARCPVWLSPGCQASLEAIGIAAASARVLENHAPFAAGDLQITPFAVPHDAREPLQYTFSDGDKRLGVLTDCGHPTPAIEAALSDCDALALECNHDIDMLRSGRYPASLKRRILGPQGHLDNATAADLLGKVAGSRLKHVVAAHLSAHNNTPALARAALADALGCEDGWISVADQETGLDWRNI